VSIEPEAVLSMVTACRSDGDEQTATSAARIARLLLESDAPFSRASYDPGHVTASAIVLDPDASSVVLVYHERLERWLQPGGHIEAGDASLEAAARREVLEETGLRLSDETPRLVALDVHEIPPARGEPRHFHHDFMFAFRLRAPAALTGATQAVWCAVSQLDRYAVDGALRRGLARARGQG
jgi:8-oxo-dGTP pyrophosphatase MutT (NUDIX family)